MPTDAAFRLSTCLTLTMACAALGYAEAPFVPEAAVVAALVAAALAALFVAEGRPAKSDGRPGRLLDRRLFLSIPAANWLGATLAVLLLFWAVVRVGVEARYGFRVDTSWQGFALTLVGPLLMALLPAKMLRKDKHAGDYWGLHGAALAGVVLACAMADDLPFAVLVGLYVVCGLWSLTLFFLARAAGRVDPIPDPNGTAPRPAVALADCSAAGSGRREVRTTLGWLAVAAAAAAPLFLVTPRSSGSRWDIRNQPEVGFSAPQTIDLTRTGTLRVNSEDAFEVTADGPRPPGPDQLWRGASYTDYGAGSWKRGDPKGLLVRHPSGRFRPIAENGPPWVPPPLAGPVTRLTFAVPARLKCQFLADPVAWVPGASAPVASLTGDRPTAWYQALDGSFQRLPIDTPADLKYRYVQVTAPPPEPGLGPGFELAEEAEESGALAPLTAVPGSLRLKPVADALVERLLDAGRLPAKLRDTRDPVTQAPAREFHEAIARAFCDELAASGEYRYTLQLRRQDPRLDPVEDFLRNTKAGHCERFASALVLLLRTQGVPAALVLGFRGCDPLGGGRFVVKQEHAHAWAEVLVTRPAGGPTATPAWHWLGLDPTPASDDAVEAAAGSWAKRAAAGGRAAFAEYLSGYGVDQRRRTLAAAAPLLRPEWGGAAAAVLAAVWLVARWRAHRRRPSSQEAVWFRRLTDVLARAGLRPAAGETPREFARRAEVVLRAKPATAAVAGVPPAWANAYYECRFGGGALTDERRAALDTGLADLRRAIR